jgi:hypothetical protein
MGITCKPIGKLQSTMRKMENDLERQKKETKIKKEDKKKDGEKN